MVVFPERLLASGKKGGYLAQFSPVPSFSEYTGPYKVGTMDVEIPVADLESPCPEPEEAKNIGTVQFRVFYPAVAESNEKPITWLPNPQRHHISAYTKFVGVQSMVAEFLSFLPRHFYYTTIPVYKNAKMEEPQTSNGRWPTMIFSHGLGGSRNSYSYIAGSLASHGVVVFCPEHRDGSAIVSFVRTPSESDNTKTGKTRRVVPYQRISHDVTPEVYETREAQLRLRLWELGLTLDSVLALDRGAKINNLNTSTTSMAHFTGRLDVNDPGSILFGGHSFGATAVYQLLKSTYYADVPEVANMGKPLFTPAADSEIRRQITERSVIMLLDMWCVPLLAPNSAPLFNLPLPAYAKVPSAPGGKAILAVESEVFYKWSEHLHLKARILSPDPSAKVVSRAMFEGREGGASVAEPNFFYVGKSVHLSQSDFGVLFPWLTKKIFDAEQPERCLRLNLRAQLQFFRENGIAVADTNPADLIDGPETSDSLLDAADKPFASTSHKAEEYDDLVILQQGVEDIDSWKWIDTVGLGDFKCGAADGKPLDEQVQETDKKIEAELEPGISADATAAVPVSQVSATAA